MLRRTTILVATLVGLVSLIATPVFAQDEGDAAEPFKSPRGYTIVPPSGWEVVSGELDEAELQKLPKNIRDHYDPKTTDAMFMDLVTDKESEFKDNLNIVVLDEAVPINDDLVGELKQILTDQYKSLFEEFELKSFEKTTFGNNEAVRIEATYKLLGYDLVLYQALMAGPDKALVITCTMDQSRKEERMKTCTESFKSVAFEGAAGGGQ